MLSTGVPPQGLSMWLGHLTTQQMGPWSGLSKITVPRAPGGSCEAVYDLVSEVPEHHSYHIVWVE